MIAYLKGIVSEIEENSAVIEVSGIGYVFYASANTLQNLCVGEAAVIYTDLVIREDSHTLYGFKEKNERTLFRLLTTVQGVGPKVCIGILSSLTVKDIYRAISAADVKLISRANGVGPKLATRIISELKGKVNEINIDAFPVASSAPSVQTNSVFSDAVAALVHLGYQRSDAVFAVDKVMSGNPDAEPQVIIRNALKDIGGVR